MDVSVIIVNYNTKELLKNCIYSILNCSVEIQYEIIIIDNASTDGSQKIITEEFPQIKFILNIENVGFGKANNQGAKIATGKYLFFLNPDCILLNNALLNFFEFMEINNRSGNIGAVGGILLNEEKGINSSYQKFPKMVTTIFSILTYHFNKTLKHKIKQTEIKNYPVVDSPYFEVDFIVGADLFMSSKVFDKLNGFDENYFLYFEETDLQKRMDKKGLKRYILKDSQIIHYEGSSIFDNYSSLRKIVLYNNSMLKYFRKNYPVLPFIIFLIFIIPLLSFPIIKSKNSLNSKFNYFKMLINNILW